ncbi:hypothetical protein BL254_03045 [Protofrankia sp. BMG5.30]|uniref:Uncharacterized protein n=1 Tax=Protofrankia coriariae TaxID=1562887 RepID=A0ABR5F666_9ACTN|nr:hypothetical protein FrCorBMG51_05720 [Protofrankia coriariae]ONH37858.1 hypothetical protein BL254_03045 [Protofrankia sp. BMG5.30]
MVVNQIGGEHSGERCGNAVGTPSRIPAAAGSAYRPAGVRRGRPPRRGRRQERERARATIRELAAAPRTVTENLH